MQHANNHDNVIQQLINDSMRPVTANPKLVALDEPLARRLRIMADAFQRIEQAIVVAVRLHLTKLIKPVLVNSRQIGVGESTEPKTHDAAPSSPTDGCPQGCAH